jgi:tight adherence protein C
MIYATFFIVDLLPLLVFVGIVAGIWAVLSGISSRNSKAVERLARLSRPQSLADIEDPKNAKNGERFQGLVETAKALSSPLMPQTELEQSELKTRLANAGFRSDAAPMVYSGLRFGTLLLFFLGSAAIFLPGRPMVWGTFQWVVIFTGLGFYLPSVILWYLRKKRQEAIFLSSRRIALARVLPRRCACSRIRCGHAASRSPKRRPPRRRCNSSSR